MICSICHEDQEEGKSSALSCGHKFHSDCVIRSLRNDSRCPLCRRDDRKVENWDGYEYFRNQAFQTHDTIKKLTKKIADLDVPKEKRKTRELQVKLEETQLWKDWKQQSQNLKKLQKKSDEASTKKFRIAHEWAMWKCSQN